MDDLRASNVGALKWAEKNVGFGAIYSGNCGECFGAGMRYWWWLLVRAVA